MIRYVCMLVWMCVCVCLCMYVFCLFLIYVRCFCVFVYICVCACIYVYICVYMCVYVCISLLYAPVFTYVSENTVYVQFYLKNIYFAISSAICSSTPLTKSCVYLRNTHV